MARLNGSTLRIWQQALALLDAEVETVDAVVAHVLLDQPRVRVEDLDAALVAALDAIEQRQRLVVQPAGVEREHLDLAARGVQMMSVSTIASAPRLFE